MWTFLLAIAAAAEPEITVSDDGTVVAIAVIDAPEQTVRAVLGDTRAAAALSPEVLEVETSAEGPCERVERRTRGLWRPMRLFALRCPTERGWREDLLESGDFRAYSSEWVLEADGERTRVEYRLTTRLGLPVPGAVLRAGLVDSTKTLFANLVRRVTEGPEG